MHEKFFSLFVLRELASIRLHIVECNDTGVSRPIVPNGVTGFFEAPYDGTSYIVVRPWILQVDLQYWFRNLE